MKKTDLEHMNSYICPEAPKEAIGKKGGPMIGGMHE